MAKLKLTQEQKNDDQFTLYHNLLTIMNIREKINVDLEKLNEEQLNEIHLIIQKFKELKTSRKKHLPRCAGIANSGIGNLSEKDEELLWQKD